jgi:hypothetical protein
MGDDKTGRALRQSGPIFLAATRPMDDSFRIKSETNSAMKLTERIKEAGAAGYILLWLLGVPIPILFVIFLLRGCS